MDDLQLQTCSGLHSSYVELAICMFVYIEIYSNPNLCKQSHINKAKFDCHSEVGPI